MGEKGTRREFLKTAGIGGAALTAGGFGFLSRLPSVSAQETRITPNLVRFDPGIEPLVRLLEDTPQADVLDRVAQKIRQGTTYQEVVAALFLAAIRNVAPRPTVGFKFHSVLVVNYAHQASVSSPESDRWLPIFWAIDEFKSSQADEQSAGGWRMPAVDESTVPAPDKARQAFIDAMENWDEKKADGAIAGLVRSAGANEIYELFYRFGARDYRSLGHKAIFVAASRRTLEFIGWQHAEPVLRSLAYACLNHDVRGTTPNNSDNVADLPWRRNQELAAKMGAGWLSGKRDDGAAREMLAALRQGTNNDACDKAVELIGRGISPQSIWDGLFMGSGELMIRQPAITALHSVTSTNAMRYAYGASGNDMTRRLMLLQNCAFVPMFRTAIRGNVADIRIDDLKPMAPQQPSAVLDEIFADASKDHMSAAGKVCQYLTGGGSPHELMSAAKRIIFVKGNDAHDYKYSGAVMEDYFNISPSFRAQYMAHSLFYLKGSGDKDNTVIERTRAALKA
jgi:hypothetical protein